MAPQTEIERSLIKLNSVSYPNVRIIKTSICKTLLALMNISRSSWLGIRYNILPSYDLVARKALHKGGAAQAASAVRTVQILRTYSHDSLAVQRPACAFRARRHGRRGPMGCRMRRRCDA
jgi:hypothetical protein